MSNGVSILYLKMKMQVTAAFYKHNILCSPSVYYSTRTVREVRKDQMIWYPGHISKGINKINQILSKCDMIIEIHDARIPFTGRTSLINSYGQVKPRILILNKVDLISPTDINQIRQSLNRQHDPSVIPPIGIHFTQINDPFRQERLLANIIPTIREYVVKDLSADCQCNILIAGLPNVGKSTFINSLRLWSKRNEQGMEKRGFRPVRVAPRAGETKSVSERILLSQGPPRLFVLDTPGVWEPRKEDLKSLLKLALCGCLNFDQMNQEVVIDYMLYWMNLHNRLEYVQLYDLPGPTDNIIEFLQHICVKRSLVQKCSRQFTGQAAAPNIVAAANLVFRDFSSGLLGKVLLDDINTSFDKNVSLSDAPFVPLGTMLSNAPTRVNKKQFPFVWTK